MAEIAGSFLGPAIEVVKWVAAPILRQFNYLCCFTTNITNLKNEAQKLQDTERDLQGKVEAARNDVRVISGEVQTWLQNSKDIKDEMDGIINEVPNVEGGCFKLRARFSLSKRAKKTSDRLKELRDQCKFNDNSISLPGPPPATKAVPSESSYEFKSRKQIEEDIMTTLRGEDVKMMGICGMGGLGKTTMAKRIMNRALEEHVFEEVVMAVISQTVEESKTQLEIGGSLGLNLGGESSQGRAQKLHERLSGPKRTLVILDDVWKKLELKGLGIPYDYKGCTILLTSRDRQVMIAMDVKKIFGMEVLSEEDSWLLFRMRVGTCVDDTKLNSLAKKVVSECAGLPIALITVGAALKDKSNEYAWKSTLRQLERRDPNIPDFIKEAYNPLEVSYNALELMYKSVFLLCCLYPEDADIPLERLNYFGMGLRIFEGGIGDVEDERNRMYTLIDVLKDRSLLLDSNEGSDYVRMHDVVRDVGIFIARKKNYISGDDSSLQRYKSDSGYGLLQIRNSDEEINFDGISGLYVLSIERCSQLTSLPFTQRPNNLITLVLDSCRRLETLSVVGELVNLEILICRRCDSIVELPPEIKGLNRMKVLDLSWCRNLKRIGRGIISSLVGLEELKMLKSFKKWEAEDREERENAGLRELGQLPNLRCLEIEIQDLALAAENILSLEVDRFTIRFLYESRWFSKFDKYLSNKKMCLNWEGASCLGDWIKVQLLRDTECLLLVGNGANEALGLTNLGKKIRYLELGECESMKKVVTSSMDKGGATVFPSIEHLILFNLPKLEEICDERISLNSFQNLKILKLDHLPVLKQLWKSSQNDLGKDFLPQLEVLEIKYCKIMEAVFLWKGEEANENNCCHPITIRFPKLKELDLFDLPNLISLCQGIEGIEFPLLKRITIWGCWKMKGMVWNEKISGGSSNNASIHALFFPQEVSFSELEELIISRCRGILSLFTSSMPGNLLNLKALSIEKCDEMVEVIKDDEEKGMSGGHQTALLFPKLQELTLWDIPKLVSFCESKRIESIQFPVLRSMEIRRCGKMNNENNSGGSSTNAADIIHLFCQSKQVSFGCLEYLESDRNPFCSHTIHVSIFDRLEELYIRGYEGSMSLFSSSITGNLVNLTTLTIELCHKMVKVIEEKEEEKEKVVSGAQRTTILFPKLHKIKLWNLPELVRFCEWNVELPSLTEVEISGCHNMKSFTLGPLNTPKLHKIKLYLLPELVRFCEWKCDVELPSLTEVEIEQCDNMKSFTLGSLNTPNLKSVKIDREEFGEVKDLNGLVQQYLMRAEETTDVATQKEAPAAAAK